MSGLICIRTYIICFRVCKKIKKKAKCVKDDDEKEDSALGLFGLPGKVECLLQCLQKGQPYEC
jgi:hypothetical protein